ncbi:MAG: hypothetical protein H6584_08185 [Flavobacteriales bacterium]|nr:hypothetical protein [Flavobacteriales bacterium]
MSKHKDFLFVLIKSLSKSEKRQFKLYAGRLDINSEAKYISLFNLLDKMDMYNENQILKSGIVKKQQLSNLKSHLYKQILISIRLSPLNQNVRIQIREQLDFATILYHKGLYKQSLKILDKAKQVSIENEEKNIAFEIIELEKIIETQYITRSTMGRAEELAVTAQELTKQNTLTSELSNLSLRLYGILLKSGYVKNDKEYKDVTAFFSENLPMYEEVTLGFREKYWLYNAYLWYSFLTQDFLSCYKYAHKWVNLFYKNENMITLNPVFFLKGNQYLLESLFMLKHSTKFKEVLSGLEAIVASDKLPQNDNIEALSFLNIYNNKLNSHFLEGTFEEGEYLVPQILRKIKIHSEQIDEHHVMVFYYKIACMYFGAGDNRMCISYLDKIIKNKNLTMREDLMCFSRILSLVAHYELGMDYHLEVQLKSTYKFLIRMNDLNGIQKEIIKFLKEISFVYPHEIKNEFVRIHKSLSKFEDAPYEKRAFLYLDIISWLESKIQNRTVGEIVREKAKLRNR